MKNQRRRRISEAKERQVLDGSAAVALDDHHRLDTGMRQGETLALRFGDVYSSRGLVTSRRETTKSKRTWFVPIATARLRAVLEWLQLARPTSQVP